METRTQLELAGVTLAIGIAITAGAYTLGKSASDDTVNQLEKTVASYEKASNLNTEEFLDSALSAINELKLSVGERKQLEQQNTMIGNLKQSIKDKETVIVNLKGGIKETDEKLSAIEERHATEVISVKNKNLKIKQSLDTVIASLNSKLEIYESKNYGFSLSKGEGVNLKGGKIQVGYSKDNDYDNICDISINNDHKKMKAGDFVEQEGCRITLTRCVYAHPEIPVSFEMVCQ